MIHSPGPWHKVEDDFERLVAVEDSEGNQIFWLHDLIGSFSNVKLAIASPLLYEALRALEWNGLDIWTNKRMCRRCLRYEDEGHAPDCTIDAALKAAEGKS